MPGPLQQISSHPCVPQLHPHDRPIIDTWPLRPGRSLRRGPLFCPILDDLSYTAKIVDSKLMTAPQMRPILHCARTLVAYSMMLRLIFS